MPHLNARKWLRPMVVAAFCALFFGAFFAAPPARATIRYEISLAHPSDHTFHVAMTIPNVRGALLLQIPAWDALYQIRDFGYHVGDLHAADTASSRALPVERLDKGTWRIDTSGTADGSVRVEYATYWDEAGPFGTQLTSEHAFLNLAMVLCYVPDRRAEKTELHFVDLPQNWHVATELATPTSSNASASTSPGAKSSDYVAPSYDALVDAPVEAGRFEEVDFQAAGRPIRVILHGDVADRARLTQQLTKIVEYETRMMGGAPFEEYTFFFHIGRNLGGGGMEHANSTAIAVANEASILNVSAHEFFHLWNVKRIRPQSLEPIDYSKEMWTPSLWFAEGVTNTYASYTLVRTGLWNKAEFLSDLSEQINDLESRPARRWQSAEESSRDAWLEKYPLYNQPDHSVSYYNKGQLLGLGLDILIRDASDNRASLDDVMRRLNEQYAQRGRFYPDSAGIRGAAEEVLRAAGADGKADVDAFFARYVAGTDELPLADWLARAGLTLSSRGQHGSTSEDSVHDYRVEEAAQPSARERAILGGLLQGITSAPTTSHDR